MIKATYPRALGLLFADGNAATLARVSTGKTDEKASCMPILGFVANRSFKHLGKEISAKTSRANELVLCVLRLQV